MKSKIINIRKVFYSVIMLTFLFSTINASNIAGHSDIEQDIITIATEAGSFSTLATALMEADLVETLKSEGPFTVFAPTDEAFAKLPEGTLENLLQDKEALKEILKYHVVSGNFSSEDVAKYSSAKTLSDQMFEIKVTDNGIFIDNAKVVTADIKASNGVIHIIDSVIIPNSK